MRACINNQQIRHHNKCVILELLYRQKRANKSTLARLAQISIPAVSNILQELEMTDDHWLRFTTGELAVANQPVPFEGVEQLPFDGFEDEFDEQALDVAWTWDYTSYAPRTRLDGGMLYLWGIPKGKEVQATALCVRAQSANYLCETEVLNDGIKSLKGLTLYGDGKNLLAFGLSGGKLRLKAVKDGKAELLGELPCTGSKVALRMEVEQGGNLRFSYRAEGTGWKPMEAARFDANSLIRWDRVQRPGLVHCGTEDSPGAFSYFRMKIVD